MKTIEFKEAHLMYGKKALIAIIVATGLSIVMAGCNHAAHEKDKTASTGGAQRLLSAGALSGVLTSLIEDAPLRIAGEPNECDASRRKLV